MSSKAQGGQGAEVVLVLVNLRRSLTRETCSGPIMHEPYMRKSIWLEVKLPIISDVEIIEMMAFATSPYVGVELRRSHL